MSARTLTLCAVSHLALAFASNASAEVRTIDGSGNNVANPTWGAAGVELLRVGAADYPGDGSGRRSSRRPIARTLGR